MYFFNSSSTFHDTRVKRTQGVKDLKGPRVPRAKNAGCRRRQKSHFSPVDRRLLGAQDSEMQSSPKLCGVFVSSEQPATERGANGKDPLRPLAENGLR